MDSKMKNTSLILLISLAGCAANPKCTKDDVSNQMVPSPLPAMAFLADSECNSKIVESPITIHLPAKLQTTILPGWAWLSFDIAPSGKPINISLIAESDGGEYTAAAIETLKGMGYNSSKAGIKGCKIALDYTNS